MAVVNATGKLLLLLLLLLSSRAQAQCSAVSTDGYTVNVAIRPTSLVPSSTSCQYGYNYNIRFSYTVTFTGPNAPASIYTLQATFTCVNAGNSSNFAQLPTTPGTGTLTTGSTPYRSADDCNTATVASLDCNHVSVLVQGPGLNTTLSCNYQAQPLPVTLTSFTARSLGTDVVVAWATASEVANAGFTVERSADGTSWQAVAYQAGAGTTATAHLYQVRLAAGTGVRYYRLRLTDTSGGTLFSPVVPVLAAEESSPVLTLAPNPASGRVAVVGLPASATLTVLNALGQVVQSSPAATLDVAGLAPGLYTVRSGRQAGRLAVE